jgi:hypothetical protein
MRENSNAIVIRRPLLLAGDVGVYILTTVSGFLSHGTLSIAAWDRMLATFLPFLAAWLALAPWLGLYRRDRFSNISGLGRAALAVFFSAPMGGMLRGLWLDSPVVPLFVLIVAGVALVLMLLWRGLVYFLLRGTSSASSTT